MAEPNPETIDPNTTAQPAQTESEAVPQTDSIPEDQPAETQPEVDPVKEPQKIKTQKFHLQLSPTMRILILVLLLSGFVGQVIIFSTLNQQTKELESTKIVAEQQTTDQQALEQSLSQYSQSIEKINAAFPDETGLSQFVDIVTRHLNTFPEGKVQFDTNAPVVSASETMPHLPVTITATADYQQFNQFQTYLANSPYLFLPLELKIAGDPMGPEAVKITLKGRLYVNQSLQQ